MQDTDDQIVVFQSGYGASDLYLRRFFIMRVYTISAAIIIAINPKLDAASCSKPNMVQRLVTRPLASSAMTIKNSGLIKLYRFIVCPLFPDGIGLSTPASIPIASLFVQFRCVLESETVE